jgi:hypothetical protein
MSKGPVRNPFVSYVPEAGLKRRNKEIKGGVKTISERPGVKVTSYSEGKG